jgi:hypothetical protein
MSIKKTAALCISLALALACAATAGAAEKAGAGARAAAAADNSIPYDDLKYHVGESITVHTRYQTTRIGVLTKFSQVELTLSVPTVSGPAELTLPKDTVLRVVATATPAPPKH